MDISQIVPDKNAFGNFKKMTSCLYAVNFIIHLALGQKPVR